MTTRTQAAIDDLVHVPENRKAEILNGELVIRAPTGFWPSRAEGAIYKSHSDHERQTDSGYAFPDNAGFKVKLPNRSSFSPDAAWYSGKPTGMSFMEGAPVFAVKVRSEGDYCPQAELALAEKRRDYFAAGTICVWDVDVLSPDMIKAYHSRDPENPIIFRRGQVASAEEAVPGWSIPVNDVLPEEED